jgi:phosphate transport system substrate-binding protein
MLNNFSAINRSGLTKVISVVAIALSLAACEGSSTPEAKNTAGGESSPGSTASPVGASGPDKLALAQDVSVNGLGATFPNQLYQTWFTDLNKKYPKLKVSYDSQGSGAGVEAFIKGTVDFGASDVAMKDEEIQKVPADKGVLMLPMTAGSIVLTYNLADVPELKLPRTVYVDILLGKIKSWDDAAIAKANPGVKLPKQAIAVVSRSDGSGTTAVFTKHLSTISPEWKTKVGDGKSVKWPVGSGAKGNDGVAALVGQTPGAIGYVEYGFAKQSGKLSIATLENKAGKFIQANDQSAAKTLEAVTLPENLRAFIVDPEGPDSYPIVTYTWIMAYKKYPDATKAKAVEAMIEYGLTEGQKQATELGYIPLPATVIQKVATAADQISPDYKISVGAATTSK